eukprot:TRINITY_DN8577_c0_g1_i2.p1 TRINITY_DN8577_c0_g1~~TRINITY_DN8577_c0_g1_i2.p1  ORF type:complete len:280 (-),score=59.57 TRINITY_DN8577_c0_g1_i2:39-878(-)
MGERKVLNKYYPPDFDPSLIPKRTKPKNDQVKVRMMTPMSIRCLSCGEYIYKGKKFNARKETVTGEEYLGIKIFRFYLKCPRCSSEITLKTDPKNSDYVCEMGATRNFEPWREQDKQIEEAKEARKQEEEGDAMKAIENRTMDSKREMDILDALDEIRSLNARQQSVNVDMLLEMHKEERKKEHPENDLTEEEQKELAGVVFKNSSSFIKKLPSSAGDNLLVSLRKRKLESGPTQSEDGFKQPLPRRPKLSVQKQAKKKSRVVVVKLNPTKKSSTLVNY